MITITDPTKFHIMQLDPAEDLTWAWRVYVPEGAKVQLTTQHEDRYGQGARSSGRCYNPSMSDDVPTPRFRFSLLNLVLLLTITALAFGLWKRHRQYEPLRAENHQLRSTLYRELGWQPVAEEGRMHCRSIVGSLNPHRHFRFLAHTPSNGRGTVFLRVETKDANGATLSGTGGQTGLAAGDTIVDLYVYREAVGPGWHWEVRLRGAAGGGFSSEGPLPPWFTETGVVKGNLQYSTPRDGLAAGQSYTLISSTSTRADGSTVNARLWVEWNKLSVATPKP